MLALNVSSDIKRMSRGISQQLQKQVAFASAKAVNAVADIVKAGEQDNMRKTFANPSAFTQKSIAVRKGNKANPVATVYVRDIAAKYLDPYEGGGVHVLPGRGIALLNPKDIRLNQFGQMSKNTLAKLKARSDVFIGPVKTKHGVVNGVWQRPAPSKQVAKGRKGMRGNNRTDHLKLLIRFGDALPVKKQLGYGARAQQIVDANLAPEFAKAMVAAAASAK